MKYDLIAIDLDGTLLNAAHQVSPANRAALHRAHDAGVKVVLCTGRAWAETRDVVRQIGLDLDAAVTAGGAATIEVATGRSLDTQPIDLAIAAECAAAIAGLGYAFLWLTDEGAVGHDGFAVDGPNRHAAFDRWLAGTPCRVIESARLPSDPPAPLRLTVVDDADPLGAVALRLQRDFDGRLSHNILSAPAYNLRLVEIFAAHVNKWSAVERLCGRWGLDPRRTAAIGDDVNDLHLIRGAGLGVAMGNAVDVIRGAARRHTRDHNDDGVAHALDAVLAGEW